MTLDPLAKELLAAAYERQFSTGDRLDWREWARSAGHPEGEARRAFAELNDRYLIESYHGLVRLRAAGRELVEALGLGSEVGVPAVPGVPIPFPTSPPAGRAAR